jgi:hypothetical protein
VFEIWELRKIFGPLWEEVAGGKRIWHIGLLHYLTSLLYVIIMHKTGKVARRGILHTFGEKRNACRVLMRNSDEKRPLETQAQKGIGG